MIDWAHFTLYASLAGGALIGAAAAMLVLFCGRIAGISGIVGGLLQFRPGDIAWRLAFLLGLFAAPWLFRLLAPMPDSRIETSAPMLLAAGVLVGLGSRLGGGCTSGHGVCGLSRLSVRSAVATMVFMAAGFATVYLMRHLFRGMLSS